MMRLVALALLAVLVLLTGLTVSAAAQDEYDCEDFTFQEDAQAVFDQDPSDPHGLVGPVGPDNETGVTSAVVCPDLRSSATVGGAGEGREERRADSPLLAGRSEEDLIPVCLQAFESPVYVDYLTQAQIDEIEATWAAYDYSDSPPPQIMGYPDPATGSCATENGVPKPYDPAERTLVCVPSGPERDGPLVPLLAINHYLRGNVDVILADPVTGVCPQEQATDDGTHDLLILVRNCEDEPAEPFGPEQEGCTPGIGAFFNVYANGGQFLGNCEAESTDPSTSTFAGCIVEVPYGSTGIVVEDPASIPNYVPGVNPVSFTAPDSGSVVVGEVYGGPVFINVRQAGSIPTDLPNTGAAPASTGADRMLLLTALSAVAALFGVAGLRIRHQP